MKTYQIYCDRGNGNELDGCWGSEHARFDNREDAQSAAEELAEMYPDCEWNVVEEEEVKITEDDYVMFKPEITLGGWAARVVLRGDDYVLQENCMAVLVDGNWPNPDRWDDVCIISDDEYESIPDNQYDAASIEALANLASLKREALKDAESYS